MPADRPTVRLDPESEARLVQACSGAVRVIVEATPKTERAALLVRLAEQLTAMLEEAGPRLRRKSDAEAAAVLRAALDAVKGAGEQP